MKYWLSGMLTLLATTNALADNYHVVSSRSLKLDLYIDQVKNSQPDSWCQEKLPLRIVAAGDKDPQIMKGFLPQVGSLLKSQCSQLSQIQWKMEDKQGVLLAKGTASSAKKWQLNIDPTKPEPKPIEEPDAEQQTNSQSESEDDPLSGLEIPAGEGFMPADDAPPPPSEKESRPEFVQNLPPPGEIARLSSAADNTAWMRFSLPGGCHFRTYWLSDNQSSALFIPVREGEKCGGDGWLTGPGQISELAGNIAKNSNAGFVEGFPVIDLPGKAESKNLKVVTVNNQRMVLSNKNAPQSWMILPYLPEMNGWQATGKIVIGIYQDQASDTDILQTRLDEVRQAWEGYIPEKATVTFSLVEGIWPQLKDPAAGAYRTVK